VTKEHINKCTFLISCVYTLYKSFRGNEMIEFVKCKSVYAIEMTEFVRCEYNTRAYPQCTWTLHVSSCTQDYRVRDFEFLIFKCDKRAHPDIVTVYICTSPKCAHPFVTSSP